MGRKGWLLVASVLICLVHVLPFYLLITTSFKPIDDLSSKWLLPSDLYLTNFVHSWEKAHLGRAFLNNFLVTVCSVVLIVVLGSCAAYPLARRKTRVNRLMYTLFVSVLIVPPLTILVPLYKFVVDIGGINQLWSVILLHVTFQLPLAIFLYTGFIQTIPRELEEAAMIDGLSRFGLFFRIILPLLKPVTATVIILTGVAVWNDYQFSVFFLQGSESQTITVALAVFFSRFVNNVGWVAAGSLLSSLPLILLYLALQKYFVSGLSAGAVKG